MKLIYITNVRIPTEKAHGIQIMQMCNAFSKLKVRGSKLDVELTVPKRLNHIKENSFEYYGIERNFKIKRLPCLDLISLEKYLGRLTFWIQSATFYISVFFYLLLTSNVKRRTSNIIYTRDILFAPFSLFWNNIIYEAHSFPNHFSLYKLFFKRIKGIVVITHKLKEFFIKNGVSEDKTIIAPDAVDLQEFDVRCAMFDARKKLNLSEDKKIILYTGHLYRWKGVNTLVQASQYLPKDVEIYFVGGTVSDKKDFERQTSNIEQIHIVGHKPHSEIPYWLKAADILVLPNTAKEDISKYWTSPMKLFEYMASKRPIVASDLPSIREVLNEKNAVLVKPDDPKALAEGIKRVLDSPELAEGIAKQAFLDVQKYTWDKRAEKTLEFMKHRIYRR